MNVRKKYTTITATSASADDLRENKTAYIKNNGAVEKIFGTIINYSGLLIFRNKNPSISLEGNILKITALPNATKYDIYSNNVLLKTTSILETNLAILLKEEGTYSIYVIAKGPGYKDSEKSNIVSYKVEQVMPIKGDLINLDMTGSGTTSQYRVLKVNGTVAEVLGMTNLKPARAYNETSKTASFDNGTIGQLYSGSDLDIYLNTTWYNTLTAAAKNALVAKNIIQKMYSLGKGTSSTATYSGEYGTSTSSRTTAYYITLTDQKSVGNRNVYALGVEDVVEYLGNGADNLNRTSVNIMFWNDIMDFGDQYIWLNSAYVDSSNVDSSNNALVANCYSGSITDRSVSIRMSLVRPAFQIDLSKISWSKVN